MAKADETQFSAIVSCSALLAESAPPRKPGHRLPVASTAARRFYRARLLPSHNGTACRRSDFGLDWPHDHDGARFF
jgi:hypothetical protein